MRAEKPAPEIGVWFTVEPCLVCKGTLGLTLGTSGGGKSSAGVEERREEGMKKG